jgi:kinesin family protein 4/21/27
LNPSDDSWEENLSTLTYATKVTKITNEPVKNDDPKMKMIQTLKVENNDLLK